MRHDLVLTKGRVLDPSQGIDRIADVAFANGKIAAVGDGLAKDASEVRDISGLIVSPGFIDLHTHVYWGGTSLGVDADELMRTSGVTTHVDAGSAGPGNFPGFRKHVIEPSTSRILAYLHVSFAGIFGFSKTIMVGESENLRLMAPRDAVAVANENRDVVVGIKVRVGRHASGDSGIAPLDIALIAAEELSLPVMCHIDEPPPSYEAVLDRLRPGDILTHCFRPFPNAPVTGQGAVKQAVIEARARGIVFDVGHGKGSFAFRTARTMLAGGFRPDVISSDIHMLSIDGPVFDQAVTLSKLLCLGMPLAEVIAATTVAPARAIRRPDLGTFATGAAGDATIYSVRRGAFDYADVTGEVMRGEEQIIAEACVIAGEWLPVTAKG